MYFYLNEYSLNGQFETVTHFMQYELKDVISCIQLIADTNNIILTKVSDLYKAKVTRDLCISDMVKNKVDAEDEKIRLRQVLDLVYEAPYWDCGDIVQDLSESYYWDNNDVSGTSMAEAAASGGVLLSFSRDGLIDKCIEVMSGSNSYNVLSVHHDNFLVEKCSSIIKISREKVLRIRYRCTRLDFSQLERKYGPDTLEKNEFDGLLKTLDKFKDHESFDSIALDDGLEYKKYSPEQKEKDCFKSIRYANKTIMKFRYSDKERVFGYRQDDTFYVLRLERDHKMSDYG